MNYESNSIILNQIIVLIFRAYTDPTIGCSTALDGIPYAAKLFYEVGVRALIGPHCNDGKF